MSKIKCISIVLVFILAVLIKAKAQRSPWDMSKLLILEITDKNGKNIDSLKVTYMREADSITAIYNDEVIPVYKKHIVSLHQNFENFAKRKDPRYNTYFTEWKEFMNKTYNADVCINNKYYAAESNFYPSPNVDTATIKIEDIDGLNNGGEFADLFLKIDIFKNVVSMATDHEENLKNEIETKRIKIILIKK